MLKLLAPVLVLLACGTTAIAGESVCYGKVSNGRIDGAIKLPSSGPNFTAYSDAGVALGRTYVHTSVHRAVVDAYRALESSAPGKVFVYGEGSWAKGGRIQPHRTHQNGLSVDFMVPVLDSKGRSVPLPTSPLNKFGYGLEFDALGRLDDLRIDFEGIAEHIYQLDRAARIGGSGLALVIIDPGYLPRVFATPRGPELKSLPFMAKPAWVRHDDHYHVDFAALCKPLSK